MRRMTLLLPLFLAFTPGAYAQRALPGMHSLELRTGMVDGWHSASRNDRTGYYVGLAMERYAKGANKWVFAAEFLNRNYPYKAGRIPVCQFTAEGGYYYKFLTDGSKTFFLYIGGSVLTGYETVNWGEKRLYDGSTILNRDRFLYGCGVTLQADIFLTDRLLLVLAGRERILWGTTTGHFHTQFGIGLKFIID